MAQNKVEYHIPRDSRHSLDVQAGQVVKIGDPVKITGDFEVAVAGAGELAVGVVYGGTVGIDGVNVGFDGDKNHTVTVIVHKPLVYMTAGGAVTAGAKLEVGASGKVVTLSAGEQIGQAITGGALNEKIVVALH